MLRVLNRYYLILFCLHAEVMSWWFTSQFQKGTIPPEAAEFNAIKLTWQSNDFAWFLPQQEPRTKIHWNLVYTWYRKHLSLVCKDTNPRYIVGMFRLYLGRVQAAKHDQAELGTKTIEGICLRCGVFTGRRCFWYCHAYSMRNRAQVRNWGTSEKLVKNLGLYNEQIKFMARGQLEQGEEATSSLMIVQ